MKNLILQLVLLILTVTSASTVLRRDMARVLSDYKTINTDVNNLNTAFKNWDGTTFGAASIQSSEQTLESAISSATTDTRTTGTSSASASDIQALLDYVYGTLEPSIKSCISSFQGAQSKCKSSGLSSQCDTDYKNLKNGFDQLLAALKVVAPTPYKPKVQSAQDKIDSDFGAPNRGCTTVC